MKEKKCAAQGGIIITYVPIIQTRWNYPKCTKTALLGVIIELQFHRKKFIHYKFHIQLGLLCYYKKNAGQNHF